MSEFDPAIKLVLDDLFKENTLLRPGKMFGFPAWYVGKKLCFSLYEQGVGIKFPATTVKHLLETDKNVTPFQPYGKAVMREWVYIVLPNPNDYRGYLPLFNEAVQFLIDQNALAG
jgi:hypothetical protein